jgi:receptor protein-tyrosine kinase
MFGRKRAHLVERAVERLAQSGELDESAANLLEPDHTAGTMVTARPAATVATTVLPSAAPGTAADPHGVDAYGGDGFGATEHGLATHDPNAYQADQDHPGTVALAEWDPVSQPVTTPATLPMEHAVHEGGVDLHPHVPSEEIERDKSNEGPGPHTLIPREEGAGQPFVDMTSLFRAGMIDWNRVRSRVSEEFRLVQRQIVRTAFTAAGAEPGFSNLLMITSSIPGEGKSFTSLNLAACIARQRDHHVLLIDIDSKRDSFCMALGLGDSPGLLDLAANPDLDASQVMAKTAIENLSVLPIGIERDLGPELFASKQMTKLIQAIGRRYADRLIVLDAPPTLSTSDPAALAPIVGQIMFVVEAERTQREEVESSLDLLQACPTITLLLNKVQVQTRYTFGAYSTYYTS